ncbi:hypothetical protein JYU34_002434 [Plutella xylostella]|uniref:Uncharacterized protein n=1 Tax=Plutella xylostella TaxID=51655 RepID=A0ABQ7R265_PLUXY|nr:hypothetical protein JYU34_002434 [Plutella xylostella]
MYIFKMLKGVAIFSAGVYTGLYIAQNYQIDKVEDPKALLEKASNYLKELSKDASDGKK